MSAPLRLSAPAAFLLAGAALVYGQIKAGSAPPQAAGNSKAAPPATKKTAPPRPPAVDFSLGLRGADYPVWTPALQSPEKLANGFTFLLLPDAELPQVRGILALKGGWAADPPKSKGFSDIFGFALIEGGTRSRTAEDWRGEFDARGIRVSGAARPGAVEISFDCPAAELPAALEFLHELVTAPGFRRSALETAKARVRASITQRNQNIAEITRREGDIAAHGAGSAWDRKIELAHIAPVSREDLENHARERLTPSLAVLGLSGKFDPAAVRARLERSFGAWSGPATRLPEPARTPPETRRLHLANLAGSPNARIEVLAPLAKPAAALTAEESASLLLLAQLAGRQDSRFAAAMRPFAADNPAYAVQSGIENDSSPAFRLGLSVRPREAVRALLRAFEELDQLRQARIEESDFAAAKRRTAAQINFDMARRDSALRFLTASAALGRDPGYLPAVQRAMLGLTPAVFSRSLQAALDTDRAQAVLAGDVRDFRLAPEDSGLPVVKISLDIPPAPPAEFRGDPESLRLGKEWISKWREALGGSDRLKAVADASWTYDVRLFTSGGPVAFRQRVQWLAPGAYRQEQSASFGSSTLYYDGKQGWNHTRRGIGPVPALLAGQIRGELFRIPFRLALCDLAETPCQVAYAGSGVIQITSPDGLRVEVGLNPETFLAESYAFLERRGGAGKALRVVERLSDYQPAGGVPIARRVEVEQEGVRFAEFLMSEMKVNTGLTAEQIGKRP
jgi:zinc protease